MKKESKFKKAINWVKEYYDDIMDKAKTDNIYFLYSWIIVAVFASNLINAFATKTFDISAIISACGFCLEVTDAIVNLKNDNRSTYLVRGVVGVLSTIALPFVVANEYFGEKYALAMAEKENKLSANKQHNIKEINVSNSENTFTKTETNSNTCKIPVILTNQKDNANNTEHTSFREIYSNSNSSYNMTNNVLLFEENFQTTDESTVL